MPRRRVRAITVTACSVALLAAGTAGASPASARAQDHQRLAPRTHFVMAPDGSSGQRAQGAAIPNIDSVKKTIRAYYGAGDAGTANPTASPYISEMRSIVAQQGRYLDRAMQAAKRHHQRPAIVFDADDTTLWTYDMEDAAMHFNFDSALQNTWVQEQKFPATPSMVEFVNRAARMGFAIFGITGRTDTQEEATVANLAKVGYTPFNAQNFYTKWSGTNPQPKYVTCAAKCTTVEYKAGTRRHIEKDLGYDIVLNVGDQWSDLQGGYADEALKLPNPTYYLPSPNLPGVDAPELEPFRAAVKAGVRAVMTAHVVVRALGPEPATVSPAAMRLLREELGFDGLVVSDALDMRAVAGTIGVEESAVRALVAGVDALCLGPAIGPDGVEAVRDAIVEAVEAGRLPEERLSEAAARVGACGSEPQTSDPDRAIGLEAARRALLVRGDTDPGVAPRVVELLPEPMMAAGETGASFLRELQARLPDASADGSGRVVLVVRDLERHPRLRQAAAAILERHPDAIVVETGVPGWAPPGASAVVVTHGGGRASLAAAADVMAQAASAASSASSRSTSSGVL